MLQSLRKLKMESNPEISLWSSEVPWTWASTRSSDLCKSHPLGSYLIMRWEALETDLCSNKSDLWLPIDGLTGEEKGFWSATFCLSTHSVIAYVTDVDCDGCWGTIRPAVVYMISDWFQPFLTWVKIWLSFWIHGIRFGTKLSNFVRDVYALDIQQRSLHIHLNASCIKMLDPCMDSMKTVD